MVLDFIKSGRHQDFLMAAHQACGHLEDLLRIDHPESAVSDELAAAISWPDALRHHLAKDAEALVSWHEEVGRLLSRFPIAKVELERLDSLETSQLQSLLSRAETTLASALQNYPEIIKFQLEGDSRAPNFKGFVETVRKNLAEARGYMVRIEQAIGHLAEKQAKAELHSEVGTSGIQHRFDRAFQHRSSDSSVSLSPGPSIEISSYMAKQWQHGEVPEHDFQVAVRKVTNFVQNGNTPAVPSHAEPHCYGGAPNHLNGVVIGGQQRLVYYIDESGNGPVVRLCCWITHGEHHDAFSRLRHQNMYRRIITNDRAVKVTRKDFDGFQKLES